MYFLAIVRVQVVTATAGLGDQAVGFSIVAFNDDSPDDPEWFEVCLLSRYPEILVSYVFQAARKASNLFVVAPEQLIADLTQMPRFG